MRNNRRIGRSIGQRANLRCGHETLLFFALFLLIPPAYAQSTGWDFSPQTQTNPASQVDMAEPEESSKNSSPTIEAELVADQEPLTDQELTVESGEATQAATEPGSAASGEPTDQQVDVSEGSDANTNLNESAASPQAATTPVIDLSPQLRADLKSQYQRMRDRIETEDAFSEVLGEEYMSYGLLLKQAGRLDEARAMFVDALHIVKVNNGVYSIEQRPVLRELFETNFLVGNIEEFEENLQRIIWLEKQYPEIRDDYSFDIVLKAGNHFIDLFLYRPVAGEAGLAYLEKANRYLSYAVERYGYHPMNELFMPYGELALVNLLKSKLAVQYERSAQFGSPRQTGITSFEQIGNDNFLTKSFSRGEYFLKRYLRKAKSEQEPVQVVRALLGLGDVNLLFQRKLAAAQYYELAWSEAQKLPADHAVHGLFSAPVELPAFNYALERTPVERRDKSVYIPLTLDINKNGKVDSISPYTEGQENDDLYPRAKRAARRLIFRPTIVDGKMVEADQFAHNVRVMVRRKSTEKS